jgi:NAD(P)-dependent dehydrogenase (short-subunit alcohol dehydrogenase family)
MAEAENVRPVQALAGKIAIVTGGAGGIGAAAVMALRGAGCHVEAFDIAGAARHVDVTDPDAVRQAVDAVAAEQGGIDILVNNAGGGPRGTVATLEVAQWRASLALNLDSAFYCMSAAIPHMRARGGGSIVNVASLAGKSVSKVGGAGYAAGKAGLLGLTRQAAGELAGMGIRVNAVCPGPTRTALTGASSRFEAFMPLGRIAEADDIARSILFLAGPDSAMCTGTSFEVDGGLSVRLD